MSETERALFHNTMTKQGCNNVCPAGTYCPEGSNAPTKCPAGRYGDGPGLQDSSCSGVCRAGYYCPAKVLNTRPDPYPCGGNDLYCPMASGFPLRVDTGFYSIPEGPDNHRYRQNQTSCEPGYYCKSGVRHKCPAGRYGTSERLAHSNCTAECPVGHYCPEGSPDPTKCPAGTTARHQVFGRGTAQACAGQASFVLLAVSWPIRQRAGQASMAPSMASPTVNAALTASWQEDQTRPPHREVAPSVKSELVRPATTAQRPPYPHETSIAAMRASIARRRLAGLRLWTVATIPSGPSRSHNSSKMIAMHTFATVKYCVKEVTIA